MNTYCECTFEIFGDRLEVDLDSSNDSTVIRIGLDLVSIRPSNDH